MVHADKLPFFAFGCLGANKVPKKAKLINSNNYINMLLYKIFQLTSPKVEFLILSITFHGYVQHVRELAWKTCEVSEIMIILGIVLSQNLMTILKTGS